MGPPGSRADRDRQRGWEQEHAEGELPSFGSLSGDESNRRTGPESGPGTPIPPKAEREHRSQNTGIPFKELQVLRRRPQLLEAGRRPYTGMVVHQELKVGVDLQNNEKPCVNEGLSDFPNPCSRRLLKMGHTKTVQ